MWPRGAHSSMRLSTTSTMRGRHSEIARGVKARLTSLRSRV